MFWEWTGGPPGGPGVVWRLSKISGSGQETLSEVQQWSVSAHKGLRVVVSPSPEVRQ